MRLEDIVKLSFFRFLVDVATILSVLGTLIACLTFCQKSETQIVLSPQQNEHVMSPIKPEPPGPVVNENGTFEDKPTPQNGVPALDSQEVTSVVQEHGARRFVGKHYNIGNTTVVGAGVRGQAAEAWLRESAYVESKDIIKVNAGDIVTFESGVGSDGWVYVRHENTGVRGYLQFNYDITGVYK